MKNNITSFIATALNDQQRAAVTHHSGSILVIAGAGSGKTRVITARIAHLIDHGVPANAIVALTFTNKAAQEMKERIAHFLGTNKNDPQLPFVGTFHSYCVRLLREHSQTLQIPFFSILDEDDQRKMLNGILQRSNLQKQIGVRNAQYAISHAKNNLTPSQPTPTFDHPLMQEMYQAYEQEKEASKCLDFDDLLLYALKLFSNKTFKKEFQERVRHILVDEYQDTNVVQHQLLKEMATSGKKLAIDSVCAVGDEDQSIYSWRGATVTNMLNFTKDFGQPALIKIEQNYRSVMPILTVANAVIANNRQRNPKELWSDRSATDRIRVLTCLSEYTESTAIAQFTLAAAKTQKKNSIAVLYRTHAQSRAIEEALLKHSIPYKIIGGIQFYERKEIKDLLAYLRLIVNPFDRPSFLRIINTPTRGLGAKVEEQFYERWHQEPFLTFQQITQKIMDEMPRLKRKALEDFLGIFDQLTAQDSPTKVIEAIVKRTGYLHYLKDAYEPAEAQERIENVKELIDAIAHYEAHGLTSLQSLLYEIALLQDKIKSTDDSQERVLLMTLHAAKGLEFDTVILSGLEEGILPSSRAIQEDDAVEEERRLFYVGITRAKERLLITHSKFRYTYGKMVDQYPSRFLQELPYRTIKKDDSSYWNTDQLKDYWSLWLSGKQSEINKEEPQPIQKTTATRLPEKATQKQVTKHWQKNQPVMHQKYGIGVVQTIEEKGQDTYLTVKFKSGTKKIVASFLQRM